MAQKAETGAKRRKARVRRTREEDRPGRALYLDEDEVKQLRKAAAALGRKGHRDATMILLAFHHGLRVSELCRLKWERVYLEKEEMYVARCKGSISKMHPLFPADVKALHKLAPESRRIGYVFKSEAVENPGPVSPSGFFHIVKRAGIKAGLGALVHPHLLRHACGYWMCKQGHDLRTIQEWLGHMNIQNTTKYTALDADHFRRVGLGRSKEHK